MRILYIEDSEMNVKILRRIVNHMGYEMVVGVNGQDGLNNIHQNMDFKLIFVDMQLPDMDGLNVIQEIRQHLPDTPIIALTAFATIEDKRKCLDAGCIAYITKPFRYETIEELLQQYK